MTESARDEALRLAREAFPVVYRGPLGSPELAFTIEGAMELIALARQRLGWVWVPDEPTQAMWEAAKTTVPDGWGNLDDMYRAMLAAAPKPGEGK